MTIAQWSERLRGSPVAVRVAPFALFVGLTFLQGRLGAASAYWVYVLKTVLGAAGIAWMAPRVGELCWRFSVAGLLTGLAVFVVWVGLDPLYPKPSLPGAVWNPFAAFPGHPTLAAFLVGVRLLGTTLVVPPLEEVFYRSFVYRAFVRADFEAVPLATFRLAPFLLVSAAFGATHREWLAGILCGLAYQGLVCWKGRLGDALVAHATTNLLLGIWVVTRGAWTFW